MMNGDQETKSLAIGVTTILATVFAMALADAIVKATSSDMTLWQVYVLRSAFVLPILLVLARHHAWHESLGWILLRSLALTLMYLAIYAAIPLLDLSVIAAALYTGPLFIVVLSAVFLREPISSRHWAAILIGFCGVLLIVRPAASGFTPLALIPVAAGVLYAAAAVLTRAKCGRAAPFTLALWLNLTLLAFGLVASALIPITGLGAEIDYPFLFGPWGSMGVQDWQAIAILAVLMVGISIGLARAYQSPRPQVIATFDYAYLIFAAFWGFVFFREVPDAATLAGMALVAGAGLLVIAEERKRDRPQGAAASTN